jgi:hypothetical protein
VEVEYLYVYYNNKKKALNFDRLIFVSVFFIFATIFHTITPDLVFSSGIDDHVLDSTDTQNKSPNDTKRVALIQNKFTYAAYQNGSFYNFYNLYSPGMYDRAGDGLNTTVTENLDMLKDRPIPDGPFPFYLHPEYNDEPYIKYFYLIHDLAKRNNTIVTNLTDMDVDQGKIFLEDDKNAYDVLILFHNEYVSQPEYNNLKKFVANGGTIVFTEANVLYAEVSYNKSSDSISLVDGHDWKFDGISATNSTSERWLDENKEWMGSNFLNIPSSKNVYFRNNPFNYTHTEEQYVTNPNAKILLDYKAYNLTDNYHDATVAAYEMNYGKGKVIHLGIWGHIVRQNPAFIEYFDKVIIPLALGNNNTTENDRFVKEMKMRSDNLHNTIKINDLVSNCYNFPYNNSGSCIFIR